MPYVIVRTDQGGGYVAPPGSRSSYVRELQFARVFETRESAERDRCPENERVVSIDDAMRNRGAR
jgi:hypothetical protein